MPPTRLLCCALSTLALCSLFAGCGDDFQPIDGTGGGATSASSSSDATSATATSSATTSSATSSSATSSTTSSATTTTGVGGSGGEGQGGSGGEGPCSPKATGIDAIGQSCLSDGDCPAGYTCWTLNGFVVQQVCAILCEQDCQCPASTTCTMKSDKAGSWTECSP